LDQAYGSVPLPHDWLLPAEEFHARLELMARVELAPALLAGARRLLLQLCAWLASRQAGVTAITFGWAHDTMRAKHVNATGSLTVRTSLPTRDIEHLARLLPEHLAHVELEAPAGEVMLWAISTCMSVRWS
jgi:protein ImuB